MIAFLSSRVATASATGTGTSSGCGGAWTVTMAWRAPGTP